MPQIDTEQLKEYAAVVFERTNTVNDYVLQTIGRRIKEIGELSAYDQQALKNIADISGDMTAITKKLAQITEMNIADIEAIYTKTVTDGVNSYKPLFDFRGMKFMPFEQNEYAQQLVRHWVVETSKEMINLSRTKAIGFAKYDVYNNLIGFTPLEGAFQKAVDDAVIAVSTGIADFETARRETIKQLGGSGVRVNYGSGVTRRLDSMVRQNLLYGAKQSAQAYDEYIGEKLGCDGFEMDYHPYPRPSHEFMGGRMFSYDGDVTIDGVTYPDGKEALARMGDYNCGHFKYDIILGVSQPRYDKVWLEEQKAKDAELIEYNGIKKTGYEWTQAQRRLENAVRTQTDIETMAKAAGDKALERQAREKIDAYCKKYDDLCEKTGLQPTLERMAAVSGKPLTGGGNGGIIKMKEGVKKVQSGAFYGALNPENDKDFLRCEEHAHKYYAEIRKRNSDIEAIAKNSNFTVEQVECIKSHIFINKYDLGEDEPTNFYPSYDIAVSWQNLIEGKNIADKDIILLQHEYYEYTLMKEKGLAYIEAHRIAQEKYNYKKAVDEWRAKK